MKVTARERQPAVLWQPVFIDRGRHCFSRHEPCNGFATAAEHNFVARFGRGG
jgi:hypothetical protein